jgi:hypothetical protein
MCWETLVIRIRIWHWYERDLFQIPLLLGISRDSCFPTFLIRNEYTVCWRKLSTDALCESKICIDRVIELWYVDLRLHIGAEYRVLADLRKVVSAQWNVNIATVDTFIVLCQTVQRMWSLKESAFYSTHFITSEVKLTVKLIHSCASVCVFFTCFKNNERRISLSNSREVWCWRHRSRLVGLGLRIFHFNARNITAVSVAQTREPDWY